jgi:hypothetical protein
MSSHHRGGQHVSSTIRFAVLNRDNFTCVYCGAKAPDVEIQVDHKIPLSKGGTNDMLNLCACCPTCNRGKSDSADDDTPEKAPVDYALGEPWGPCAGEPEDAFAAFVQFRDMRPPRKVVRPGSGQTAPTSQLYRWFTQWDWKGRAAAYDVHIDVIVREEREAAIAEAARSVQAEHMFLLADLRSVVSVETSKLLALAKVGGFATVKPSELARLADTVIKNDRLVRGETTEKVDTGFDLSKLSVEELRLLNAVDAKLRKP